MKKILFTLLFCFTFAFPLYAQEIRNAGVDNTITSTIRDGSECWECNLVEGIYTYTFNFVYKMYDILSSISYTLVLVGLGVWFLWLIWNNVIKKQEGDVYELLKGIFVKLFTILFVLTMLSKVPANEIFHYTIDPIMNLGSGFAKWILIETRNENSVMQTENKLSNLSENTLPKFNCDDIQLSENISQMLRANSINPEDETNTNTIKNLICITREYSNTYNTGINLGFKIATTGLLGIAENRAISLGTEKLQNLTSFIPNVIAFWVVNIAIFLFQGFLWFGWAMNFLVVVLGVGIALPFLYVAFTYITLIIDIIIQLAMVGVMMPITIGSWAFSSSDMVNLRSKLSEKLFWGILRCAVRLAFLAVSISISVFLLTELLTNTFDTQYSVSSLFDYLNKKQTLGQNLVQWTGLNDNALGTLNLFLNNMGLFIAILFATLVSWMLLGESISMADSFSDSIYSGLKNDNIFKGLKKITMSTINYIKNGAQREVNLYNKLDEVKKNLNKLKEPQNNDAKDVSDLPPEFLVQEYEKQKEDTSKTLIGPQTKEEYIANKNHEKEIASSMFDNGPQPIEQVELNYQISDLKKQEHEFVSEKLSHYKEYKELPLTEKEKIEDILLTTTPKEMDNIYTDESISHISDVIQKDLKILFPLTTKDTTSTASTPMEVMKEEYMKEKLLKQINKLPRKTKKDLKEHVEKGRTIQKAENKTLFNKMEAEIAGDIKARKDKLEKLYQERKLSEKLNKNFDTPKIDAKSVILSIKRDELDKLNSEIDSIDMNSSPLRLAMLRRKVRKLKNELSEISEKNAIEMEDIVEDEIAKWKKNKRRGRGRINPNKKL